MTWRPDCRPGAAGREGEQVRWNQLFADLEAQLEAEEARDLMLEVADRIRRERAQGGLPERLL